VTRGPPGAGVVVGKYAYDSVGWRNYREEAGSKVNSFWADGNLAQDRDATTGSVLAHYHHADGNPFAVDDGDEDGLRYYHQDALGTTLALSNVAGALTARYSVGPFGDLKNSSGADAGLGRFLFTGHEYDSGTGLTYARARYYDSETGGFLSQDSWGGDGADPFSLNKYAYGYHNPMRFTDPSGHVPVEFRPQPGPSISGKSYEQRSTDYCLSHEDKDFCQGIVTEVNFDDQPEVVKPLVTAWNTIEDPSGRKMFIRRTRSGRLESYGHEGRNNPSVALAAGNDAAQEFVATSVEGAIDTARGVTEFAKLPPWEQDRLFGVGARKAAYGAEQFGNQVYDNPYGLFGVLGGGAYDGVTGFGSDIGQGFGDVAYADDLAGQFEAANRLGMNALSGGMQLSMAALPAAGAYGLTSGLTEAEIASGSASIVTREGYFSRGVQWFDEDAVLGDLASSPIGRTVLNAAQSHQFRLEFSKSYYRQGIFGNDERSILGMAFRRKAKVYLPAHSSNAAAASTAVHEGVHMLGVRDSQRSEVLARAAELLHRNGTYNRADLMRIYRQVRSIDVYRRLPAKVGRTSPLFPGVTF
jgi:RHS repeat-associated protein